MVQNVGKIEHELVKQHRPKIEYSRKSIREREGITSMLSPLVIRRRALIAPPHGAAILTIERIYFALNSEVLL
jgi:hypothetical protein